MGRYYTEIFARRFDVRVVSSRDVRTEVESLGGKYTPDFNEAIRVYEHCWADLRLRRLAAIRGR